VVQESVLERIDDDDLAVYVVWEPIFRTDDQRSSRKASTLLPDPRVTHYWVETQDVGKMYQPAIGLEGEAAWDVYLVYPPGIGWFIGSVPVLGMKVIEYVGTNTARGLPAITALIVLFDPDDGRLPEARLLDGPQLASEIARVLSR